MKLDTDKYYRYNDELHGRVHTEKTHILINNVCTPTTLDRLGMPTIMLNA